MITFDELKHLNEKELSEELIKSKIDLLKIRLAVAARQSKETSKIKALRKYVARIKTMQQMMAREQIKENPKSSVTK